MASFFKFKSFSPSAAKILEKRGLVKFGKVQKFIDSECLKLCDPKTPKDESILIKSGKINTELGSGWIIYKTPYARRLYYHPEYDFSGSPERGAYWFDRMKLQYKEQILKGATKIANGAGL